MALDPLGLELQMVASSHVGAGEQICPLQDQSMLLTAEFSIQLQ